MKRAGTRCWTLLGCPCLLVGSVFGVALILWHRRWWLLSKRNRVCDIYIYEPAHKAIHSEPFQPVRVCLTWWYIISLRSDTCGDGNGMTLGRHSFSRYIAEVRALADLFTVPDHCHRSGDTLNSIILISCGDAARFSWVILQLDISESHTLATIRHEAHGLCRVNLPLIPKIAQEIHILVVVHYHDRLTRLKRKF